MEDTKMRPKMISLLIALAVWTVPGSAQTADGPGTRAGSGEPTAPVSFALFAATPSGEKNALASGIVDSQPGPDTRVLLASPEVFLWTRDLHLADGFVLHAIFRSQLSSSVVRPSMAMTVRNETGRSTYQSFRSEGDGVFRGAGGRVRVTLPNSADADPATATVEFLDDFVFEYEERPEADVVSHEIHVESGSRIALVHGTDLTYQAP
jgi:hypothetical protein